MAILALSHVMKSDTYKHQNLKFRGFRQSLRTPDKLMKIRIIVRLGFLSNLFVTGGISCSATILCAKNAINLLRYLSQFRNMKRRISNSQNVEAPEWNNRLPPSRFSSGGTRRRILDFPKKHTPDAKKVGELEKIPEFYSKDQLERI